MCKINKITGKEVLPVLAERYNKLYLAPDLENLEEEYSAVALQGMEPKIKSLSHFHGSDNDELSYESTPAGDVLVVTLADRRDFEMLLNIMINKSVIKEIPATQGASILDGVVNWNKINDHLDEYVRSEKAKGIANPDTGEEFKLFTSDGKNYKEALIVLSVGPYSAVTASAANISEDKWLNLSHIIRKYHECTHFICRRLYRDKINAIWDELVADAVGIYAALGRFDLKLAEVFLGITDGKYTGGRLENYVSDKCGIDELSAKVHVTLLRFDELLKDLHADSPYDVAILLEEKYDELSAADYLM